MSHPIYRGIEVFRQWRLSRTRRRHFFPASATVPPRATAIWRERPDLRELFDLSRQTGREGLIAWYLRHGFVELGLGNDNDDAGCIALMAEGMPQVRTLSFLPITWLMHLLLDRCPTGRLLHDQNHQEEVLSWFFARGLTEANLSSFLTATQANILLLPDPRAGGLPRLLHCIWRSDPQLHERFAGPDDPNFHNWCLSVEGSRSFPILTHPLVALASPPSRRPRRERPFGVNLFGHAYARSGISEDIRMACRVLEMAGVPFSVYNVSPGTDMPEEELSMSQDNRLLPYAINMFCMPAATTVQAALDVGRAVIADYYNIGFWPWELPEMPTFWRHAYDFVDEVWASTRFTSAAFSRSSPRPVRQMAFAVQTEESEGLGRQAFGLPAGRFLFGFAFDSLSGFARKAPLATVRAFQQAFPSDRSVGLVIKGLRIADNSAWREILNAVGNDDRIQFVTSSLSRGELFDFWRALDCFVSLHRSEGFGRNIAEMMLLRKPVIVTAHSGNMDFTDYESAALVSCSLRPVAEGEYPFGAGQLWAEPNIADAAKQMKRMVVESLWRERLAATGQARIAALYDPSVVAPIWRDRLTDIYATRSCEFSNVG